MITGSAQLATTIENRTDPVADVRVTVNLPAGPYSDFSTVMRSLSLSVQNGTDLPSEVRDVVGFSTLGGDLELTGMVGADETKTVAWLFDPDSTTSPLYRQRVKGAQVTVDIGYYLDPALAPASNPEWVRKFTGTIATFDLDHAAATCTLHLVDLSAQWDNLPAVPAVNTGPPYNAGMTSEYVMDAIIRSAGRPSTWPATRPSCWLAIGMRTSMWPEVGAMRSTVINTTAPTFAPGAHGSALTNPDTYFGTAYTVAYDTTQQANADTLFVEMWASAGTTLAVSDAYGGFTAVGFQVDLTSSGALQMVVSGSGGGNTQTVTVPADSAVHYIGVLFTWTRGSTAWSAHVNYDGTVTTVTGTAPAARDATAIPNKATLTLSAGALVEAIQVTGETAPAFNNAFAPAAIIDTSLNPLTVVPEISAGTKGSDELQKIAGAELGYARWDESGVFRFTNRVTMASAALARTITSASALRPGIVTNVGAATEYDHVQVPFTEWNWGAATAVFVLDTVKQLPPGVTSWTQPLPNLAANIPPVAAELPNGHNPNDGGTWFRVSGDPNGLHRAVGVSITVTQVSSQTVSITATNLTSQTAWLTTPGDVYTDLTAGSLGSGLWIGGTPATPDAEALTNSIYAGGTQPPLVVSSNPYIQHQSTAKALGDHLLPQLIEAVRDFTGVAFDIDARLQLPDRVQIIDPDESGISEYVQLWGWQITVDFPAAGQSGGSWGQTADCRALGPPGAWLGGIAGRSEGGITTWGY